MSNGDAPTEFEITPAMIEAGIEAFCETLHGTSAKDVVERVWWAMASECPRFCEQTLHIGESSFGNRHGV